ncbi:MAG: nuclear transport factor 2 family protein [Kordiimonadaceae bacterium]|nr:nuclear transport factor 2 family protein [Kordiimonadaceae bacterium]
MPMNKKEMIACVTALAQAKSRQNIAEALEVYHPDVEMITPAFAAHARGREETGRQLGSFFKLFPDYAVAISSYTKAEDILLADGIVTVTPNTKSGTAKTAKVPVTMVFEFKDNTISKETFNIDLELVSEAAGIPLSELLGS